MKWNGVVFLAFFASSLSGVVGVQEGSPVTKVTQLLADLEAKVVREGQEAKKLFEEFMEWCEGGARDLKYSVKTAKSQIENLKATIAEETSSAEALTAKVEELGDDINTDETDLKAATEIRVKGAADFKTTEKDLTEVISALERAVAILSREMRRGGGAFMQLKGSHGVLQALNILLQASEISSGDASTLTALVQSSGADSEDDEDVGAPEAAAYKGHSEGIIETLETLLDKAREQLETAQKKEMNEKHNFDMLKQSLEDEIKYATKDMDEAKKNLAGSNEAKATAEGDFAVTAKELKTDEDSLETMKTDCMTKSQEHETESASRAEEIKAIQEARKVIAEKVGGAAEQTYDFFQKSIVKNSRLHTGADLANYEAVQFVRNLARKFNDDALAQLGMRMASVMRFGSTNGEDPFAKVKALITDMIERLEGDAEADASHKAYCDKETGETIAKKQEKEALVDHLTTKIDNMKASSAQLKEEIAGLQRDLAEIASTTAEATELRNKEKAAYEKNSKEMKEGIEGVKLALGILRDYYAKDAGHVQAEGASAGIIGLLEVVEADFSKGLSEMNVGESTSAGEYRKMMNEKEIEKATKESSVKYKTKESVSLDRAVAEASSDLSGTKTELAAVLEYLGKMNAMCVAKPETYDSRKSRREAEIAGLKEALEILSGEAAFLQKVSHGVLRGVQRH